MDTTSRPSALVPSPGSATVAVIGLGPMGTALARAFLDAGVATSVWNRTPAKAAALEEGGAAVAATARDAVVSADLVVTCLRDHVATRELIDGLPTEALAGRTVVVLASSTPGEARETQRWADARGIGLLNGAIMVPTPLIGTPHALVLYSGRQDLLERHRPTLEVAAPRSELVGTDPGLASLLDVGMLEVFFSGMTAFLHASALATAHGLSAAAFVPWAKEMLAILPDTYDQLAADVDAGTYPGTEDNLVMDLAGLGHIVDVSREAGLDTRLAAWMQDLARRAVDEGHGADGWSRVVEQIRREGSPGER